MPATTFPTSPTEANRTYAIGKAAAGLVLCYLALLFYSYYNFSRYSFIMRMAGYPVLFGLAGIILTQTYVQRLPEVKIMVAYLVWIVLETFLVYRSTSYQYEQTLSYAVAFLLACYPAMMLFPADVRKRTFHGILHCIIGIFAAACLFAIVVVILQTQVTTDSGLMTGLSSTFDNRLIIIGAHPNYTGGIASTLLLLSLYMILARKNLAIRVYYGFVMLVFYVMLALTDSRTNMLAVALGVGMLGFLLPFSLAKKIRPAALRAVLGIVCAAAVAVVVYMGYSLALRGVEAVSVQPAYAQEAASPEVVITEGRDLLKDLKTATGRTKIWKEAFDSIRANPSILLKGLSNQHVYDVVPNIPSIEGRLHNSFLQVLVALGIPGLLLLLCFLTIIVGWAIRLFFMSPERAGLAERFLPAVLAACLFVSMAESFYFIESHGVYSPIFFLVAGYVVVTGRERAAV